MRQDNGIKREGYTTRDKSRLELSKERDRNPRPKLLRSWHRAGYHLTRGP
jgi:hypothetical protein